MSRRNPLFVALTAFALSGCYHQVVYTGATPGTTVVKKPWTATWIFGLVAADVIDATADCPRGIAIVETQQSFLNGLVGGLTLGIYTPQAVTITCAGNGAPLPEAPTVAFARGGNLDAADAAARRAYDLAVATGGPVIVRSLP